MDNNSQRKFPRCIICSDRTVKNQCSNIFTTTLEDGKILLSDFVKNVLSCSVLIVVPPEFYVCKRCFTLCTELDSVQVRCKQLQRSIQLLFSKSKKQELFIKELTTMGVNTDKLITGENENLFDAELENFSYASDPENEETVENIQQYLNSDFKEEKIETIEDIQQISETYSENESVVTTRNTNKKNITEEVVEDSTICWTCDTCDVAFEREEELDIHSKNGCKKNSKKARIKSFVKFKYYSVKLKNKKKVLFCNRCSYETEHSVSMEQHILDHKEDPVFMCDTCGKRFHHQRAFNKHRKTHDESRQFPCKLCSYRSKTSIGLQQHVRQHVGDKKYSCKICDYKTIKKNSLLIHLRSHTGERPYCCPSCPYRAKDHSTLHRHRRLHEGLKLYSCTVCSYRAVQKAALNVHMRSHTGEKPYSCQDCDYESTVKHNVRAHILAKHSSKSEKPFACSECDYKTSVKRSLISHIRKHTGEKPFACTQCEYRARHSTALKYHQKSQHPTSDHVVLGLPRYVTSNVIRLSELAFSDEDASDGEC